MKSPKVSFCIFTYNQEDYILDALKGAASQDYDDMEIIVSDDCSSDNTAAVIKEFVEQYQGPHHFRVNINETNMGIAKNVCKVFYELAQGDILILADGDDVSLPNRTSITVEYFDRFPEVSSLSFFTPAVDAKLNSPGPYEKFVDQPHTFSIYNLNDFFHYDMGCLSDDSRAWRRSVIEAFPPIEYAKAEDYVLYLRSFMMGSICYIREYVLLRRMHGSNTSLALPSKAGRKRSLTQFDYDIEWALSHGYISEKVSKKLHRKMKKDMSFPYFRYPIIFMRRKLRDNSLVRTIYGFLKR